MRKTLNMSSNLCILRYFSLTPRRIFFNSYLVLNILAACLLEAAVVREKRQFQFNNNSEIRTEYIDRNNKMILDSFNLTEDQKNRIAAGYQQSDFPTTVRSRDFSSIKEIRLNAIRHALGEVVGRTEPLLHEMAAYPKCTGEMNESSWQNEYNLTIQFSNSILDIKNENYNLESALLRLYKINPNRTDSEDFGKIFEPMMRAASATGKCMDPYLDSQIRVTVSIVQQLRRNKRSERKKRICNTLMMNVSKTGWVEIDIRRAIHIWNEVQRQQHNSLQQAQRSPILVGYLMIEVHDEEERPLKPGLFFKPPSCEEAELAIPWNYYGSQSAVSSIEANEVPRYPRIDMKLIGYAAFSPKNLNKHLHQFLRNNLRKQLYNLSQDTQNSNESITSNSPNMNNENDLETSTAINSLPAHLKAIMHSKQNKNHYNRQQKHHSQHQHQNHHQQDHNSQEEENLNVEIMEETFKDSSSETEHLPHHKKQRHNHHNHQQHHHNHGEVHSHHEHHRLDSQEQHEPQDEIKIETNHPRKLHHRLIPQPTITQAI